MEGAILGEGSWDRKWPSGRAKLAVAERVCAKADPWSGPVWGGKPAPDLERKAMRPSVCVIGKDGTKGNGVLSEILMHPKCEI